MLFSLIRFFPNLMFSYSCFRILIPTPLMRLGWMISIMLANVSKVRTAHTDRHQFVRVTIKRQQHMMQQVRSIRKFRRLRHLPSCHHLMCLPPRLIRLISDPNKRRLSHPSYRRILSYETVHPYHQLMWRQSQQHNDTNRI